MMYEASETSVTHHDVAAARALIGIFSRPDYPIAEVWRMTVNRCVDDPTDRTAALLAICSGRLLFELTPDEFVAVMAGRPMPTRIAEMAQ